MFQATTAQAKIGALRTRERVVQGGTSSSKTFSIIPILIMYAANNPLSEISIVSESIPHLRRGAIRDFLKIQDEIGNDIYTQWNRSTLTYTFLNGSIIEFFSADQSDKLRGARRDILFVNEANNISWSAYHQMAIRTRKFIYVDFNPTQEFWAHTELVAHGADHVILTYKDNEALEPAIVQAIEEAKEKAKISTYWANWWKVYGCGELGTLQGAVYDNWKQCDKMPDSWKWKAYGLDWGYSSDPSAGVEVCYFDGALYVNELLYEKGLTNPQIAERLQGFRQGEWIADSSEPKSIAEVRGHGFRIRGCPKGADSIRSGIDKVRSIPLFVTSSSINIIKELRGYVWKTDKTGEQTGQPVDNFNHALDALRYVAMEKLKSSSGKYAIR